MPKRVQIDGQEELVDQEGVSSGSEALAADVEQVEVLRGEELRLVEEGLEDIRAGRVYTLAELKEEFGL